MTVVITDLDNTLYDWVTFYAASFEAMLSSLEGLLQTDREQLLSEFRILNQESGSSEKPFTAVRLPAVRRRFGNLSEHELIRELWHPFAAFDTTRKATLQLYPGVAGALEQLTRAGVKVVAHTEAPAVNAYHRLVLLGIADYFERIYVRDDNLKHADPARQQTLLAARKRIRVVHPVERKPEPRLLHDICAAEGVLPEDAWYVGDSLTRDIAMANRAGVRSIWAEYGTHYDPALWQLLVCISHWTDEDVAREAKLRTELPHVHPDFTIASFGEVPTIVGVQATLTPA